MNNKIILRAENISKGYGNSRVLDLERLEIYRGETLCILGPNGAGKSTLVRILNLVEEPDSGDVWFDGARVGHRDVQARRRMAGVFQRPHMLKGTVYGNVAYGLRLRRLPAAEVAGRVEKALWALGISHLAGHDARTLSGGEAQRVALARATIIRPELLFLDEPAANLDPLARRNFHRDLRAIVGGGGMTAVYVSHSVEEAMAAGDRLAVMKDGRLVQIGPCEEVYQSPASDFVARFLGAEEAEGAEGAEGSAAADDARPGHVVRLHKLKADG